MNKSNSIFWLVFAIIITGLIMVILAGTPQPSTQAQTKPQTDFVDSINVLVEDNANRIEMLEQYLSE